MRLFGSGFLLDRRSQGKTLEPTRLKKKNLGNDSQAFDNLLYIHDIHLFADTGRLSHHILILCSILTWTERAWLI